MKKHSNSVKKSESPTKRRNPRAEERRDSSEVMTELVSQLRQQLEEKSVPVAQGAGDDREAEYDAPETIQAITEAIESHGHVVVPLEASLSASRRVVATPTAPLSLCSLELK